MNAPRYASERESEEVGEGEGGGSYDGFCTKMYGAKGIGIKGAGGRNERKETDLIASDANLEWTSSQSFRRRDAMHIAV